MNVAEAQEESKEETKMNNPPEERESLILKRVLVKTEKQVRERSQRKSLFRKRCKSQDKCCKMVIDSSSIDDLVSTDMVQNP